VVTAGAGECSREILEDWQLKMNSPLGHSDDLTANDGAFGISDAAVLSSASNDTLMPGDPNRSLDAKILIIDDERFNILVTKRYLSNAGYHNFVTCTDSTEAFALMQSVNPDVVILDILMPEVSGLDILQKRQEFENLLHIPVLVLTASSDNETKRQALELGATDFLAKPVNPNDLLPRVRNAVLIKAHHDHLANYAQELNRQVEVRTRELLHSREDIIHCLGRAAEYRDNETGRHVVRVGAYCGIIAKQLGQPAEFVEMIELAAQLHDIGKIGIPDSILLNPGKLNARQFEIMRTHCTIGREIIKPSANSEWSKLRRDSDATAEESVDSPLMDMAAVIAQTHHEKWDGSGYPFGISGEDIPLVGRICAVADVYDALSTRRPYKPAFPQEKCFAILLEERSKHFDPRIVDAFFARIEDVVRIQYRHSDNPPKYTIDKDRL
jgi:putative two-component system response regulator